MRTEAHRWPTRPSENQDSKLSRQAPSCQDQVWESTHNCSGVNSRLELPSWSICTWRKLCVVTQRLGRPEVTGEKLSPHLAKFVTRKETTLGTSCPALCLILQPWLTCPSHQTSSSLGAVDPSSKKPLLTTEGSSFGAFSLYAPNHDP